MKPPRARPCRPILDGFARAAASLILPRGWPLAARRLLAADPDLRRIVAETIDQAETLAAVPALAAGRYLREVA